MAIYHLSAQIISRGAGRCSTAAAAYRAAEKIHDERMGRTFDFTNKQGVEHSEILTPEGAPAWMQNRKKLWNAVEKIEVRKDAQLAREVQVALPVELSKEGGVELVREFAKEHFVKHGMVADFSIHRDNPENPHAHLTLTTREVTEEGFGAKNRDWNSKEWLKGWRESWEHCANRQLAREGHEQRIDHRSHEERGIQLEPTRKIGASEKNLQNDGRDIVKERMEEQREIAWRNGERILKDPNIALEGVTYQQTTFTKREVGRWLNTRTADGDQFRACLTKVMGSEELVSVGVEDSGRERFTTKEMVKIERELRQTTRELLGRGGHRVDLKNLDQAEATRTLTDEQKNAFRHVAEQSPDIAVVEGYAGTGKSYMLGAAREAWEAQGYRVLGASLAGKAAEGLQISSGIQSRSIHAWEYAWKKGYERLGRKDVFVIDEAGMVGARQMDRVIERVREAGAKMVLVGDTQQLQAIEAGAPMRMIAEEVGSETLSEIRRQREAWQKQATVDFHDGRTEKALEAYRERGFLHEHETQQGAIDSIVDAWDKHRKEHPKDTQIMLAYKRVDVQQMNERARATRRAGGELSGKDINIQTERGERDFAARDRVCFLKNDRYLDVKNGTLGTIEIMEKGQAVIRLDGPEHRRVVVDFKRYNQIDHGYAATLHKSQGATVDRAHAMASRLYDRHTTYVGMTRHVGRVDLHWSREEFSDRKDMYNTLSREKLKQNIVDYEKADLDNRQQPQGAEKGRGGEDRYLSFREQLEREIEAEKSLERNDGDHNVGPVENIEKKPIESLSRHELKQLRSFRERYLQAERIVAKGPMTGGQALENSHDVYLAKHKVDYNKGQCQESEKEIREFRKEHPVKARLMEKGLAKDHGVFSSYRQRIEWVRKAESDLERLRSDPDLRAKAERIAADHNANFEGAKTEMKVLREDFEKGEKLIPEVVIEKCRQLEKIADRPEMKMKDFLREFPEVKDARSKVGSTEWTHGQAAHGLEKFKEKHPVKASINVGKSYELREEEKRTKRSLDRAKRAYDKTWKDPKLRDKAGQLAEEWGRETVEARDKLDELKPYHEKAIEGLEKDRELGLNKDMSKDLDQGRELSLGKGFDRGFGF